MTGNIVKNFANDPVGKQNFVWSSPKSKNVDYKVEHPVFSEDSEGRPQISYIDQFPEPQSMAQGNFLQKLSDALEESENKITTPLCLLDLQCLPIIIFGYMAENLLKKIKI